MKLNWDRVLIEAAAEGNAEAVRDIIASADTFTNSQLSRAAMQAAAHDHINVLQVLTDLNWDINFCERPNGPFILAYALRNRKEDMAIWLLEHGADPNTVDDQGLVPLAKAAQYCTISSVSALIERGATVPGSRALTAAAVSHQPDRIAKLELLLEHGAQINEMELEMPWHREGGRSRSSGTALHAACRWGFEDSEAFLIERGADPNVRNSTGLSINELRKGQRSLAVRGWSIAYVSRSTRRRLYEERVQEQKNA